MKVTKYWYHIDVVFIKNSSFIHNWNQALESLHFGDLMKPQYTPRC